MISQHFTHQRIKGGRGGGVTIRSPNKLKFNDHGSAKKNLKEKENMQKDLKHSLKESYKQRVSTASNNNYESQHMNRFSQDSNSLHDLDIKYLTNTRQKVQSRKNLMELKNQMSPVYYNRDAERFSYLEYQDPLIGEQFQYQQGYQPNQYLSQQMNNQQYNMNYYKQYQQYENPYQQPINKGFDVSNLNELRNNFNPNLKSNSYETQSETSSFLSKSSEYDRREDSFGNIEIVRRRVQPTQNDDLKKNYITPNLPPPPPSKLSQMDPDLQKYTRGGATAPISTAPQGDNNRFESIFRRQTRLLPRINMSTVVFIVLVIYIIYKNIVKYSSENSSLSTYLSSFNLFNSQNKSNKKQDIKDIEYQNRYKQIHLNNGVRLDNNENQMINNRQQNERLEQSMDSQIAKTFAMNLINELIHLLLQKGKVYSSEYQDSLSNRFQTPLLREILPELNKLVINSKQIRIQYDVMNGKEYYELYPDQN